MIKGAVAVAHPGTSTVAIEALAADKIAISTLTNEGRFGDKVAQILSFETRDIDEMVDLIHSKHSNIFPSERAFELFHSKILIGDRHNSSQEIANIITNTINFGGHSGISYTKKFELPKFWMKRKPRDPGAFKRPPIKLETLKKDIPLAIKCLELDDLNVSITMARPNCYIIRPQK